MFSGENQLREEIRNLKVQLIHLSEEISNRVLIYVEKYFLSHHLEMADALIASTAISYNTQLMTANDKHYKIIKELSFERFNP